MYMSTSLAHYQLPLFGVNVPALATEIGADQRSILLQPISAAGVTATESWPSTIDVKSTDLVPLEYRNWLAQLTDYQEATGTSSSGDETGSGSEAAASGGTEATGSSTEAGGEPEPAPDAAQNDGADDGSEPADPPGDGDTSGEAGSGGSGGGGLLGMLFG